jgi:hypothetical protein
MSLREELSDAHGEAGEQRRLERVVAVQATLAGSVDDAHRAVARVDEPQLANTRLEVPAALGTEALSRVAGDDTSTSRSGTISSARGAICGSRPADHQAASGAKPP